MPSKVKQIGIIAEDASDFESSRILIKRIIKKNNLPFKKKIGEGCGKIKRKAASYAKTLFDQGCDTLILMHDLDKNDLAELEKDLKKRLLKTPITNKFVCIPVEEIEAWFLSDPDAIKSLFKLSRVPKFQGNPETIRDPKEKLGEQVHLCSNKEAAYINTVHNKKLAEAINIDTLKLKCKSFEKLHSFISKQTY